MIHGQLISNMPRNRHHVIEPKTVYNPFQISENNPYNKYGYYLGMKFVETQLASGKNIASLWLDNRVTMQAVNEFLGS